MVEAAGVVEPTEVLIAKRVCSGLPNVYRISTLVETVPSAGRG